MRAPKKFFDLVKCVVGSEGVKGRVPIAEKVEPAVYGGMTSRKIAGGGRTTGGAIF